MEVIDINSIYKDFGEVKAVNGISLKVKQGEVFGLLGPNGAGKTTTLSMVEGLIAPDSGTLNVLGKTFKNNREFILKNIGVQLQSSAFIPELNLIEQIRVMAGLYGLIVTKEEAETYLDKVGLKSRSKSYPGQLSGGQRQRLSIVLAIIHKPKILFLDEPTNGLDPQTKLMLWELIKELKDDGMTIVLTTHNIQEAESICDRVAIINKGKIVAVDSPFELIKRGNGLSVVTVSSGLSGYNIIENCTGVKNTDYRNDVFRITTNNVIGTIKDLFEVAGESNTYLGDLNIKQPNLEDVFIELTGSRLSGSGE